MRPETRPRTVLLGSHNNRSRDAVRSNIGHRTARAVCERVIPLPTLAQSRFPGNWRYFAAEPGLDAEDAELVYRLTYNGDVVAFKMGRRQGARRAHI
jgi:hypothetical protein